MKKISALIMMPAAAAVLSASDSLDDELFSAARTGDSVLVENLLDRGADIEARGPRGITPLMMAAFHGEVTIVEVLLDRGADIEARDSVMDILLQAGAAP